MELGTLRNWLVITVSVTVPSVTFAGTWDATTGFNQTASNTGVWTYGTTTVTNTNWESTTLDANGYAFAADTGREDALAATKVGILAASLLSGLLGGTLLAVAGRASKPAVAPVPA